MLVNAPQYSVLKPAKNKYNPAPAADAATSPPMSRLRTGTSRLRASVHWLRQHFLSMIVAPAALIFAVTSTVYYWTAARFVVSTDDAYVQADSTIVASRVSGYVSAVLIQD